jgi:hypothetical protein
MKVHFQRRAAAGGRQSFQALTAVAAHDSADVYGMGVDDKKGGLVLTAQFTKALFYRSPRWRQDLRLGFPCEA